MRLVLSPCTGSTPKASELQRWLRLVTDCETRLDTTKVMRRMRPSILFSMRMEVAGMNRTEVVYVIRLLHCCRQEQRIIRAMIGGP